MISKKIYSKNEIMELLNTKNTDVQGIKRMLVSRGYEFEAKGRGRNTTFEITETPSKFKTFCLKELNIAPQTDIVKLRNLFYYYLNDEFFRTLPYSQMELIMEENGQRVGRNTISNYIKYLAKADYIYLGNSECRYYKITTIEGRKTAIEIDKETYCQGWKIYWEYRKEIGYEDAYWEMRAFLGGHPFKRPIPQENAFCIEKMNELIDLVNEEYENSNC